MVYECGEGEREGVMGEWWDLVVCDVFVSFYLSSSCPYHAFSTGKHDIIIIVLFLEICAIFTYLFLLDRWHSTYQMCCT